MKEFFKQHILNFHNSKLPEVCYRDIDIPELPPQLRKALVLVGMRRSGKTFVLYQIMHGLLSKGVSLENMIYINFEDERLIDIKAEELQNILDALYELYPNFLESKKLYLFFDEIHEVLHWNKFIRRLLETENVKIYITGSSAKLLSKEIATSLRGRTITREVFPFSFSEYLRFKDPKVSFNKISTKKKALIKRHLGNYLIYGGFPERLILGENLFYELLQGYVEIVVSRDIIDRYQIKNIKVLKSFIRHCLRNPAALLSVNKVYHDFKSQGLSLSKDILYEFLLYIEDAYCVFSIPIFSLPLKKSNLKPKKIYPVDQGLISAFSLSTSFNKAAYLESMVFNIFRRQYKDIFYYNTKSGKECDFLILKDDNSIELYQVSVTVKDQDTLQREVSALQESMQELKITTGTIVTLEERDEIKISRECNIKIIPVFEL